MSNANVSIRPIRYVLLNQVNVRYARLARTKDAPKKTRFVALTTVLLNVSHVRKMKTVHRTMGLSVNRGAVLFVPMIMIARASFSALS